MSEVVESGGPRRVKTMRLLNSMTVLLACATVACRTGEASESYDGVVTTGDATSIVTVARPAQGPDTVTMASEVDARWATAILSGAGSRQASRARRVTVARPAGASKRVVATRKRSAAEQAAVATGVDVVLAQPAEQSDPKIEPVAEPKPVPVKVCGVVNRRS
jgi:hypothetical protein